MCSSLSLRERNSYFGAGRCGEPGTLVGGRGAVGPGVPGFGVWPGVPGLFGVGQALTG